MRKSRHWRKFENGFLQSQVVSLAGYWKLDSGVFELSFFGVRNSLSALSLFWKTKALATFLNMWILLNKKSCAFVSDRILSRNRFHFSVVLLIMFQFCVKYCQILINIIWQFIAVFTCFWITSFESTLSASFLKHFVFCVFILNCWVFDLCSS